MEKVNFLEFIFTSRVETSVYQDKLLFLFLKMDTSAFSMLRVKSNIFKCF